MSEKRFNCVLGNDYHIINDNFDNMTYFLQERNDVVKLVWVLNEQQAIIRRDETSIKTMMSNMKKLEEENEQLRKQVAEYELILRQHEFAEKEGVQ